MKRFAVIGLGRFGRRLATSLTEHGHEVVAVDHRQEIIEEVFIQGNEPLRPCDVHGPSSRFTRRTRGD